MNKLYGFCRLERNGNLKCLCYDDYKTKKLFLDDLRRNGYRVIEVLNQKQIDEVKSLGKWDKANCTDEVREYIEQCL